MNSHYLYFLINALVISVPAIASFYKKYPFYKQWKYVFPATIIVAFFFIIWDVIFTKNAIWGFNERYIIGSYFFKLPIEEILFFILIPYACTFTYFSTKVLFPNIAFFKKYQHYITIFLCVASFIIGVCNLQKAYTVSTFLLVFVFLLVLLISKYNLAQFYFSYCFIIVFLVLTNGILTGSFIEEEVVWYNNNHNLSIRFGTIPVEDFFYGFLLCGLNIVLYEILSKTRIYTKRK